MGTSAVLRIEHISGDGFAFQSKVRFNYTSLLNKNANPLFLSCFLV
jgi:hypothetical protein